MGIENDYHAFGKNVLEKIVPHLEKKIKKDWQEFEKVWWTWSAEDIVFWWKYNPKIPGFNKYKYNEEKCKGIIEAMEERGLRGKTLNRMAKEELYACGMLPPFSPAHAHALALSHRNQRIRRPFGDYGRHRIHVQKIPETNCGSHPRPRARSNRPQRAKQPT